MDIAFLESLAGGMVWEKRGLAIVEGNMLRVKGHKIKIISFFFFSNDGSRLKMLID